MEKGSQSSSSPKLVLDTSYVLPFLGVVFKQLRKAEASFLPAEVGEGIDSLVYSSEVELLPLTSEVAEEAYKLIKAGWKDIFDAIAYATAKSAGALLLTLDEGLRRFLAEKRMPYAFLVDHRRLAELRQQGESFTSR